MNRAAAVYSGGFSVSINPRLCHSEPVTDVTGVGIRNLLAGNLRKSAGIMRFGSGLPRQCAHWLAMTGFFGNLRKTAQRAVFLYFSRSAQQNRRGSNSLPGIPRMAAPFAGTLPLPLDLTRFAPVEAAYSTLPAAFQKETPSYPDGVSFCDCPQVLLSHSRTPQGRGVCGGNTGRFLPRVQSPARRRPLLRSKSAAPKRKTPVGVSFILEQGTGIEPASSAWEADVLPMY